MEMVYSFRLREKDRMYYFSGSSEIGGPISSKNDWTSFDLIESFVTLKRGKEIIRFLQFDDSDVEIELIPQEIEIIKAQVEGVMRLNDI